MPLYLVLFNPAGRVPTPKIFDLDTEPAPTITTGGIADQNRSHYFLHYAINQHALEKEIAPLLARQKWTAIQNRRQPA